MEVIWPLEMIREGVVIVDSPGLNDPYSNDLVTKEYLPNADAIIFCINATVPYGMTDRGGAGGSENPRLSDADICHYPV